MHLSNKATLILHVFLRLFTATCPRRRQPSKFNIFSHCGEARCHGEAFRRGTTPSQSRPIRPSRRVDMPPPEHYDAEKQIHIPKESLGVLHYFDRDFELVLSSMSTDSLNPYLLSTQPQSIFALNPTTDFVTSVIAQRSCRHKQATMTAPMRVT